MANWFDFDSTKKTNAKCRGCFFADYHLLCDYILVMKQRRPCKMRPGGGCDCYTKSRPATPKSNRPLVILTKEQKKELAQTMKSPQKKYLRLDTCPEAFELYRSGALDVEIAISLGVAPESVCRWRKRNGFPTNYKRRKDHVD